MDFNKFFQSKNFKVILVIVSGIIICLFIFQVGMMVGYKKANFSFRWGENYHQNFGGPKGGLLNDFRGKDFIDAHGVFGQIMKIDGSTLVIKGKDGVEKIVLINKNTSIKRFQEDVKISDLKTDDFIVVIGEPNDAGQIEAKFIRFLPSPGETSFYLSAPIKPL